jgi:Tfp pilus assembly pilus retraction ATPase PilT
MTVSAPQNLKKIDFSQVDSTIEASTSIGMISMQQYAKKLLAKNLINPRDVEHLFKSRDNQQQQKPQIPLH